LIGAALMIGFVVLRAINRYGDPVPWTTQSSPLFTALSFLNCTKYPPSIDYLLMTLGPALLVLAILDGRTRAESPLATFGRVPMFFYLLHIPLLSVSSGLYQLAGAGHFGLPGFFGDGSTAGPFDLPWVYLVWIACVAVLYLPCR